MRSLVPYLSLFLTTVSWAGTAFLVSPGRSMRIVLLLGTTAFVTLIILLSWSESALVAGARGAGLVALGGGGIRPFGSYICPVLFELRSLRSVFYCGFSCGLFWQRGAASSACPVPFVVTSSTCSACAQFPYYKVYVCHTVAEATCLCVPGGAHCHVLTFGLAWSLGRSFSACLMRHNQCLTILPAWICSIHASVRRVHLARPIGSVGWRFCSFPCYTRRVGYGDQDNKDC